jgi:hypothetical protein
VIKQLDFFLPYDRGGGAITTQNFMTNAKKLSILESTRSVIRTLFRPDTASGSKINRETRAKLIQPFCMVCKQALPQTKRWHKRVFKLLSTRHSAVKEGMGKQMARINDVDL